MNFTLEKFESKCEHNCYKDKFYKLLEEKSILEDEMVSIAGYARTYQSEAKLCKEEVESLKSSYQ